MYVQSRARATSIDPTPAPSAWAQNEYMDRICAHAALPGRAADAVISWLFVPRYGVTTMQLPAQYLHRRRRLRGSGGGEQQRPFELVQSLEVPIIPIGGDILLAPLVGSFDAPDRQQPAPAARMVARQRAHTVIPMSPASA